MNVDDDSKEPLKDLKLSLGSYNQGTAHLIENSGAGANATSRVEDMAFVGSDHLIELVWSPQKGLSIKCTNCGTAAEESRRTLTTGMGNKVNEVKVVTDVTSSKSSGRNVRVGIACQSAYMPIIKGKRCNSSPCLKDASELHVSPVKPMLKVSSRKRSFHTINKDSYLCLREKTELPQLGLASNINDVDQQSASIPEENQKRIALKKQELNSDDDDDVSVCKDKSYRSEDSATESKINEYRRKGKAKVLSDANFEQGEEERHGSIESFSSVGSFCSRQRKPSLGQKVTNEGKRIKTTTIQQSPRPMSLVNGSSSFIGWISNMTKGINKANKDGNKTPCLALTLTPYGPQNENRERELNSLGNNDKYPRQRMGFQNIFQSIYCTSSKVHEQPAITDGHQKNGGTFDACIGNSMVDVVPLSMHEMTSSSCKGDQLSGNEERQLKLRKVISMIGDDNRERNSSEKGASGNMLTKAQSVKLSTSRSSPDKCGTQNDNSTPPPENNAGLTNVLDPLQSFWITRFCPKFAVPESVTDNHGQILLIDNQRKNSKNSAFRFRKVRRIVQAKGELIEDLNKLASGQGNGTASDSDASVGPKVDTNFFTQTSDSNIDQIFSTERFKSSEAMVSMFARRLDAIKHMKPAGITSNASGSGTTCFYCGKKGHNLHNCSAFTENKLEGPLDSSEKTPCLCIRCFQLGHWATDCLTTKVTVCRPLAIPNNEFLETPGDRNNKELLVENKDIRMADIPATPNNQNNSEPDLELYKFYSKSGPVKFELEESAAAPLSNSIGVQSSDIPKEYFDTVRLLRLSRREILKLMDSRMELSNLEGFFLRLRLGNMETGHGGTGYHVAYIDGVQSEEPCRGSKFILPVNMGSVKILVGSQSISNQEFLEDELMAWWSATVKNGNKLPTLEVLNDKLLQRNKLQL